MYVPPRHSSWPRRLAGLIVMYCLVRGAAGWYAWATRETTVDRLTEDWYTISAITGPEQWVVERRVGNRRERARVRLLAVRFPHASADSPDGARQTELHATATRWAQEHWLGKSVWIELGKRQIDHDGLLLITPRIGDQTAQEELVRQGWLLPDGRPGDASSLVRQLREAAAEARGASRGLWAGQLVARRTL